jgi:hypothetical protein
VTAANPENGAAALDLKGLTSRMASLRTLESSTLYAPGPGDVHFFRRLRRSIPGPVDIGM